jgi:zinc transport system ATP-binding protein
MASESGPQDSDVLVHLNGASFGYGNTAVLNGVDLELRPGDWVEVEGANGSGKTTLLRGAIGLLAPRSGSSTFLADRIGYVPQVRNLNLLMPLTVREVVAQGFVRRTRTGRRLPSTKRERNEAVSSILEEVDLRHAIGAPFEQLSGGQQQRVLIARALVGEPSLLALDEPWNGIDRAHVRSIAELVARYKHDHDIGVLCISHGVEDREDLVDRSIRVEGGGLRVLTGGRT